MRVVCDGLTLADAVLKVSKALPQKITNPILEGIKLTAKGEVLTLFATEMNFSIEKSINATIIEEGEAVLPGRLFTEFIRKLTNEQQVEILLQEGKQAVIKYTDSQSTLQCLDIKEYPVFYQSEEVSKFFIGEEEFKDVINKVIFSASTDDSRPILKGVLLEIEEFVLTAVALDSYRMAICNKPLVEKADKIKAIVPARSLLEISKLLEEGEGVANVSVDSKTLFVDLKHTKISTSLLAGEYINYKQVLPNSFQTTLNANREQFANALERANIISRGEKKNLVKFEIKENILILTAESEMGSIKESISIRLWGKDLNINFNAKYISDCLRAIQNEFIKIQFNTSVSPCIITPGETDECLYLILPIRMS